MKKCILFFYLSLIINILTAQNCPSVNSENGYVNGTFHPAWLDCTLPFAPVFDENHFQIIPNSPFNFDENTPYYHISYPLLKKIMSRTVCFQDNHYTWTPNPSNPTENYCNSPNILGTKKEILSSIYKLRPLNAKCIIVQWLNESWKNDEKNSYNIAMDLNCEIHALTDSVTGENFGNQIIVGGYLPEIMRTNFVFGEVSDWVYAYFDEAIPAQKELYESNNLNYSNGWRKEAFGEGTIIPDMSRRITQFWFFERAAKYIDAGCELISLGQVEIMDDNDPGHVAYYRLVKAIKRYAAKNARRHFVLIEAETQGFYYSPDFQLNIEQNFAEFMPKYNAKATWKINYIIPKLQDKFFEDRKIPLSERQLIFDYHNQPLRMQETLDRFASSPYSYQPTELKNDENWVFGKSKGGKNPNLWTVSNNPYYSMIDNGSVGRVKNASDGICDEPDCIFQWGYDEMTWYALQPDWYRMYWVCYMKNWLNEIDTAAYPVYQCLRGYYWQHYKTMSDGFGGIYAPNEWEFSVLKRIMENPESAEDCPKLPENLNIEGEQVIYVKDSALTKTYRTQFIPNQQYIWQILANGISRIVTDSPYLRLNIAPNMIDTVYYLIVFSIDSAGNANFASLNRFPIIISRNRNIQYYPNPVNNLLHIIIEGANANIEIYDTNGSQKEGFMAENQLNIINVSAYQAGMYFLKVREGEKVSWFKFLKL